MRRCQGSEGPGLNRVWVESQDGLRFRFNSIVHSITGCDMASVGALKVLVKLVRANHEHSRCLMSVSSERVTRFKPYRVQRGGRSVTQPNETFLFRLLLGFRAANSNYELQPTSPWSSRPTASPLI